MRLTFLLDSWYPEWAKEGEEALKAEFSCTEAHLCVPVVRDTGTQGHMLDGDLFFLERSCSNANY